MNQQRQQRPTRQALRIQERIAALDANDRQARFDLASRCGKLGDAVWQSDPQRALKLYERALTTAQTLVSKEQFVLLRDSYLTAISRPLILLGRTAEARKALEQGLELANTEPQGYADQLGDLSVGLIWPQLELADHRPDEARKKLNELIQNAERLRAGHPQDLAPIWFLSSACRMLASITTDAERREALQRSAAAWHSWKPATTFTRREEQKDLAAARR